jgi:hypothetical protein
MNLKNILDRNAETFASDRKYSEMDCDQLDAEYRKIYSSEELSICDNRWYSTKYRQSSFASAASTITAALNLISDFLATKRSNRFNRTVDFYIHTARYSSEFATREQASLLRLPGASPKVHDAIWLAWDAARYLIQYGIELPEGAHAFTMSDDESDAALEG